MKCLSSSAEVTDSSSEGSVEEDTVRHPPQPKQKALQTRRSMLDHLDDSSKVTPTIAPDAGEQAPPAKRVKKEEEVRRGGRREEGGFQFLGSCWGGVVLREVGY